LPLSSNYLIRRGNEISVIRNFTASSLGSIMVDFDSAFFRSQLYEYRYLQNKAGAKLVLVLEKPLPRKEQWMIDYLENDREINVIWDGDGQLHGTDFAQKALKFLRLS